MSGYDLPDPPSPEENSGRTAEAEPTPGYTEEQAAEELAMLEKRQKLMETGLPTKAITAVVMVLTEEGNWIASSNLHGTEGHQQPNGQFVVTKLGTLPPIEAMEIRRQASLQEIGQAASQVGFDVTCLLTGSLAAQNIHAMAQQQMAQAQAQAQGAAILERLQREGAAGIRGGGLAGPNGRPL